MKLKYVGRRLADEIQKIFDTPPEQRKSRNVTEKQDNPKPQHDSSSSKKKPSTKNSLKPYAPRVGTGNYAVLMALAQNSPRDEPRFFTKKQVIELAQPFSETSFEQSREHHYTAWSGVKRLEEEGLVKKVSNPGKFVITSKGHDLVDTYTAGYSPKSSLSSLEKTIFAAPIRSEPRWQCKVGSQAMVEVIVQHLQNGGVPAIFDESIPEYSFSISLINVDYSRSKFAPRILLKRKLEGQQVGFSIGDDRSLSALTIELVETESIFHEHIQFLDNEHPICPRNDIHGIIRSVIFVHRYLTSVMLKFCGKRMNRSVLWDSRYYAVSSSSQKDLFWNQLKCNSHLSKNQILKLRHEFDTFRQLYDELCSEDASKTIERFQLPQQFVLFCKGLP